VQRLAGIEVDAKDVEAAVGSIVREAA
jgi:hypothetical protein